MILTYPPNQSFPFLHFSTRAPRASMAFAGNTWWTYLLFSLIASFALLGNSLVLYVLLTKRSYLKQPYNIFIFSLALTDILSGVFLVSTGVITVDDTGCDCPLIYSHISPTGHQSLPLPPSYTRRGDPTRDVLSYDMVCLGPLHLGVYINLHVHRSYV